MRTKEPSPAKATKEQPDVTRSVAGTEEKPATPNAWPKTPPAASIASNGHNARPPQPPESQRRESLTPKGEPNRPVHDINAELVNTGNTDTRGGDYKNAAAKDANSGLGVQQRENRSKATSEELRLERLREAVLLSQQKGKSASTRQSQSQSLSNLEQRRISPIQEEPVGGGISPTLAGAFASPLMTGTLTASTESTESAKTVKGSAPPTPGAGALRTPSYPFPYIPGTPKLWSSQFHRPFTTLSPTVSAQNVRDVTTPRERVLSSGPSTPAASAATFVPDGTHNEGETHSSEEYPSPSLYDLVLALNVEPGLDAWWTVVVSTLREWYGAERVTLAVPADASELETVPWGQKATYNELGSLDVVSEPMEERKPAQRHNLPLRKVFDEPDEPAKTLKSIDLSSRPKLAARHSYAGFERDRNAPTTPLETPSSSRAERPRGPLRTVSHAPTISHTLERPHPLQKLVSIGSTSDPDFSSIGPTQRSATQEAVFPTLRALDIESNPLLDSAGVIRVLDRGRLVTLTRDYVVPTSSRGPSAEPHDFQSDKSKTSKADSVDVHKLSSRPIKSDRAKSDYFSSSKLPSTYEEYEQFPASPWAQSPAPSPAIQADPEDNPFFVSPRVDEDSFNPTESQPNYSKYGQVAAIGIDRASTVTHVPLIHPLLSQVLPPLPQKRSDEEQSTLHRRSTAEPKTTAEVERRAPIAIISFLSQTVPYPQNLTQSLKLLAPHLATTFANANQYTNALKQAASIRHRRLLSNPKVGFAALSSEPESLEDLLRLDISDINASVSGSITSPSDYSAHSRFSPGGSLQGTPGWDPGSIGFSRHSVTNTPAPVLGNEIADSYFDAKKRSSLSGKDTKNNHQQQQRSSQTGVASPALDLPKRSVWRAPAEDSERAVSKAQGPQRERSSSPPQPPDVAIPRKSSLKSSQQHPPEHRQYTQLHSFGADFQSSFSTLTATANPPSGDQLTHVRSNSVEVHDMLPPSEKLLRIIIDALPVQVFMATPSDGSITWANAKYLAYRGQDSREIMQDPWHTIHKDDLTQYMELWKRSLHSGVQLSHKVRLQRFDGQYRWFFVKIAPLKDKRQNIVHWVGTNMDFHEQHIAETNAARQQETAASEAKYRALANSSPQIVFAVTKQSGLTFCNSQWTNYSGQTEEDARGVGFTDFVHPEDLQKCRLPSFTEDGTPAEVPISMQAEDNTDVDTSKDSSSHEDSSLTPTVTNASTGEGNSQRDVHQLPQAKLSKLATTGILKVVRDTDGRPSYSTEVRLRNKDGKFRWHLVRVLRSELRDSDEDDQTWYGTCTDINDHKLLEHTLKETMDAKSRFLSNMSHEIRTPLNGITGMVNFLIDSNLTAEQMEHVNIIRNSTEGLRDLINDILDLSKVEAGMITLNMDWLHVRSLIEEVNDLTSALAIDKGLELNYIVDEDVPLMVKGDRFRIRQVLLNVIGNAIKFTERGEVFVRCQLLEPEASQLTPFQAVVQFEIIDTGSGFTENEAEFLFKRFSQIDGSSTRQHGGTGLGLAISMQLVELHGGRMKASSIPGKGSTFTFSIKFSLPSDQDQPPVPTAALGSTAPPTPGFPAPLPRPSSSASVLPSQYMPKQVFMHHKEDNDSPGQLSSPGNDRRSSVSSGSSAPSSAPITQTSSHSERSSQSSFVPDPSHIKPQAPIILRFPGTERTESFESTSKTSSSSRDTEKTLQPIESYAEPALSSTSLKIPVAQTPLFSVLVVCPLQWTREATVKHVEMTLPKTIPHNITARKSLWDSRGLLAGADAVNFTHVVLSLPEANEVWSFMDLLLTPDAMLNKDSKTSPSPSHSKATLIIICDLTQRREIMQRAPRYDYDALLRDRRLQFIFKPLKPSKLAFIFDPQREREVSSDRALEGAQAVAFSQKQVFEEMKRRLGNKDVRVLLVEDNKTNQMVLLKFLKRAEIQAEAVMDGVQCTDKVFSNARGTYSIILVRSFDPEYSGTPTDSCSATYTCLTRMVIKLVKTFAPGSAKISIPTCRS